MARSLRLSVLLGSVGARAMGGGRRDGRKGGSSGRPGWAGGIHRRRKAPGGKWRGPGLAGGQPFKEPGLRGRATGYPVRFGPPEQPVTKCRGRSWIRLERRQV